MCGLAVWQRVHAARALFQMIEHMQAWWQPPRLAQSQQCRASFFCLVHHLVLAWATPDERPAPRLSALNMLEPSFVRAQDCALG